MASLVAETKESASNEGDLGVIPGLGKSPGGHHSTHSSTLAWRILMDKEAWWTSVHGVAKSQTYLSSNLSLDKYWWYNVIAPNSHFPCLHMRTGKAKCLLHKAAVSINLM